MRIYNTLGRFVRYYWIELGDSLICGRRECGTIIASVCIILYSICFSVHIAAPMGGLYKQHTNG